MAKPPKDHDEYLAALPDPQRKALQKLRATIRAAAPDAEECISYRLAAFEKDGKLVAYGATAKHCAFFPMNATSVAAHAAELVAWSTSKGTIRFQPDQPLPAALVKKIVKERLAENAAARGATKAARKGKVAKAAVADSDVDEFLRDLDHPMKAAIATVRRFILDAAPGIADGIKWNAPSFRTSEWFATFNLRARDRVQLIFHFGAKSKDGTKQGLRIPDPDGMVEWLASDRAMVTVGAGKEIAARRKALQDLVRAWLAHLPPAKGAR